MSFSGRFVINTVISVQRTSVSAVCFCWMYFLLYCVYSLESIRLQHCLCLLSLHGFFSACSSRLGKLSGFSAFGASFFLTDNLAFWTNLVHRIWCNPISTFLFFSRRSVCSFTNFGFYFSTCRTFFSASVSGVSFKFLYKYSCIASVIDSTDIYILDFFLHFVVSRRLSYEWKKETSNSVILSNSQLFFTSRIRFQTSAAGFLLFHPFMPKRLRGYVGRFSLVWNINGKGHTVV